ncbi:MAG: quinolinate synthase NadA, partial [Bacteroidales bacterium]|nr:quinolinate synthase NadA [Bacteroidales bacterium]
ACHVHENFSPEAILELRNEYPEAKILVHPECEFPVRQLADYIGSTAGMIEYAGKDKNKAYIVATEPGIIHQMKKRNPAGKYIAAPAKAAFSFSNDCNFMKIITMEKIYNCLKYEEPFISLDSDLIAAARLPLERMLAISEIFAGKQ